MNLGSCLNYETGRYLSDAWKCGTSKVEFLPPPAGELVDHHYTPAQKRVLALLTASPRALTVIEMGDALQMSRFTVYDCVMNTPCVLHTGMRGREKCYWVRK